VLFSHLGKTHAVVLWLSAAVYTAALIVAISQSDAAAGTTGDHVLSVCLLLTIVAGGLQAIAFTAVAAVRGYRPGSGRATRAARPADADPAPRTRRRAARVVGVLGVITVVALLPAIVFVVFDDVSFQRHHRDAQVTITSVRIDTNCRGWPVPTCTDHYVPTVRFSTPPGEIREVETSDSGTRNTSTIETGRTITVHYDPNDLGDVRLGTGWGDDDVVLIAIGIIAYGYLGFAVIRARRASRRSMAGSR
jgi:hypothetical protein